MGDFSSEELRVLKAFAAGILNAEGKGGGSANSLQPLSEEKLREHWANKRIEKDPRRWNGPTMVGKMYSDVSPEWHDINAEFYAYKARKGREDPEPRKRNNGKFWYEADEFESRLSLTWARFLRAKPAPAPAAAASDSDDSAWAGDEAEPPF